MADMDVNGSETGAASSAPQAPMTAEGMFDAARNHFFPDDNDEDGEVASTDDEGDTGESQSGEGESDDVVPGAALGGETEGEKKSFSPYEFKGKVLGEEVSKKFESEKELNKALAQGLAAPKLYSAYKEMLQWKETIKEDLQYAQDLSTMSKEDPKALLNLLSDEMIPQEVLMDWVYEKFQDFKRIANMSDAERERELKLREAQRIIESNKQLQEDRERLETEKQQLLELDERKKFDSWKSKEVDTWLKKVPPEYKNSVEHSMRAVVAMARAEIDAGKRVTFKQMSQWLSDILAPAVNSRSPSSMKKEAGRIMEQKKNQSTDALRGAVSKANANQVNKAPQRPARAEDIFEQAKAAIAQGRMKLRN